MDRQQRAALVRLGCVAGDTLQTLRVPTVSPLRRNTQGPQNIQVTSFKVDVLRQSK